VFDLGQGGKHQTGGWVGWGSCWVIFHLWRINVPFLYHTLWLLVEYQCV